MAAKKRVEDDNVAKDRIIVDKDHTIKTMTQMNLEL